MLRIGLLFFGLSWTFLAQAVPTDDIRRVIIDQQSAWNQGDLDAYMQGYWRDDKMRFVSNAGFRYGWEGTLEAYKKHYPSAAALGELTFSIEEIKLLGDQAAIVVGQWELVRLKDNPKGVFTLLMEKIDDAWVITHDHTSE